MAYTVKLYPRSIEAVFNKEIDYDTDSIKVMLLGNTYTFSESHKYKSDLTGEITGTGYSAGGVALGTKTVTLDGFTVKFDAANTTWGPGASFTGVYHAIVYNSSPATDATRPLIADISFGESLGTDNGVFTLVWDNTYNAVFQLRAVPE